jgi:hypothetical protein
MEPRVKPVDGPIITEVQTFWIRADAMLACLPELPAVARSMIESREMV